MIKKLLLLLLVIYAIGGFFILPNFAKPKIVELVQQQTDAKLSIQNIYFNPFSFNLRLDKLKLSNQQDKELISFDFLEINLEPLSLVRGALHVKSIVLHKPKISLIYHKDKSLNLLNILKPTSTTNAPKQEKQTQLPRLIVGSLKIVDAKLAYEDFTTKKKFDFDVNNINFRLKDIDTNDFKSSGATLRFTSALGDGGFLTLKANILGFKPLKISGDVEFKASKLYTQWRYIQDKLGIEVADGKLSLFAKYFVDLDDLNSLSIDDLSVSLERLRLKPKDESFDILNLDSFYVRGGVIKPLVKKVVIKSIDLNSLHVEANRDKNGVIDWSRWFQTSKAVETKEAETNATKWSLSVDEISLDKISMNVNDKSVTPSVKTTLNELNIKLNNLTLAGEKPFEYKLSLLLNNRFICDANGEVTHKNLTISSFVKCKGFDVVHYKPYISQNNIELKSALIDFDANLTLKDSNNSIQTVLNDANINLYNFSIDKKNTHQKLLNFSNFKITNISADTHKKVLNISKTALNGLDIKVLKDKNNNINFGDLMVVKESKKPTKNKNKDNEQAYRVKINQFKIADAKVRFDDESLNTPTTIKLDKITLKVNNIDSDKKAWLNYGLNLRVNKSANISVVGKLRHSNIKQEGRLRVKNLALNKFSPYISQNLYANIDDGYLNLDTKVIYKADDKKPDLKVSGNLNIKEFLLTDSRDKTTLLAFNKTELKSFNLNLLPNNLYVDEVGLDAFYVDAQIDKNHILNFAKLKKEGKSKNKETNQTKDDAFVVKILKLHVSNGTANFADYSLPIDFKTSIHSLNGNIYAISTSEGEISYIDIDGEVDKYGSTKLKGSIEVSDIKSYTDINFNFRNLNLNAYSGYSAQFAGYKIQKGRLFLDLGYKIFDSQLKGENSLIIKKVELGNEIEDENITKLPLGFAIALLEDSEGVIDINMPVEGDMNKPDFKYGTLVLKTFANLIVKAVASPFKFLGEAMGFEGDDLKYIDFEVAQNVILPPEREKLDNLLKILIKKPKLKLSISGTYNKELDKKAMQIEKLTTKVLKIGGEKGKNGMLGVKILEKIFLKNSTQKNLDNLKKKAKKDYQKLLFEKTTLMQKVSLDDLKNLAYKRAKNIQNYLLKTKKISNQRVLIQDIQDVKDIDESWIKTSLEILIK